MSIDEFTLGIQPPPKRATVWRFMSMSKLMSLLTTESLAFARIGILNERDPKEGSYTQQEWELAKRFENDDRQIDKVLSELQFLYPHNHYSRSNVIQQYGTRELERRAQFVRDSFFVNCWNISKLEPAQLWASYASEHDGVAIKSTIKRLKMSVEGDENKIILGKIRYSYHSDKPSTSDTHLETVYRKRTEFKHENELRLCVDKSLSIHRDEEFWRSKPAILIKCDLPMLVSEVRVAPFAGEWAIDAVRNLLHTYGLDCKVTRSVLA